MIYFDGCTLSTVEAILEEEEVQVILQISVTIMYALALVVLVFGISSAAETDIFSPLHCTYNGTHCSCRNLENAGNCLRHVKGSFCLVEECGNTGYRCDCSGTELCSRASTCNPWVSNDGKGPAFLSRGQIVECNLSSDSSCLTRIGELDVPPPEAEEVDFRMVKFGEGSDLTMFNMTAFVDSEMTTLIASSKNMHGRWKIARRLLPRYITFRIYAHDIDSHMLCAIYNTYGLKDDGLGPMIVAVTINALSGQQLEWSACDDVGECKGDSGSRLTGLHNLTSSLSDGWCIKPLKCDGSGVSVTFSKVDGMRGISFQSTAGQEEVFKFGEGNGMGGTTDLEGLVHGGSTPKIVFNMQGIEVTF